MLKRNPVIHNLPAGWKDMDAVKYLNITDISGLYQSNNSVANPQSGTHNCKNVYQDEFGNLTIRPALRNRGNTFNLGHVVKRYDTSLGTLWHYYSQADKKLYYLRFNDSEDYLQYKLPLNPGNVAVHELNGKVYILYTEYETGTLTMAEWTGQGGPKPVEPDLPLSSSKMPISRLYNLLSDKIKVETSPVIQVATDDLFSDFISSSFTGSIVLASAILQSGHVIFVTGVDIIILVPYGGGYKAITLPVEVSNTADILIEDMESDTYCRITVTDKINTYECSVSVYDVYYSGALTVKEFTASGGPSATILAYKSGYDGTAFLVYTTPYDGYYTAAINWFGTGKKLNQHTWIYDLLTNAQTQYLQVEIAVCKHSVITLIKGSTYVGQISVNLKDWYNNEHTKRYESERYEPEDAAYLNIQSGNDNWYLINNKSGIKIYTDWLYTEYTDNEPAGVIVAPQPHILPFEVSPGKAVEFLGMNAGLRIRYDGRYYCMTPSLSREYIFSSLPSGSEYIFNIDSTIVVDPTNRTVYSRDILAQYITFDRPVSDNFPVLSDIKDQVLTSFYLDNIYWFVTKRRIFGTGVVDEQFSIKYFDPRKYFYFEEELTGAIRVSDSAFWVFHRNGAYLIYKSSSSFYDELSGEYIETITWLCTSTAKSKGCDFDNAVVTLPITSKISCVTTDDISVVQMLENVQTDDRILVPITLGIQKFVSTLLYQTSDVVVGVYKYYALYFLNPQQPTGKVPVLAYNTATDSWWYWEFPVDRVAQVLDTESGMRIIALADVSYSDYDFYDELFEYSIGGLKWNLYADRVAYREPMKVEWFWESSVLHFNIMNHKKQLLNTNFVFSETDEAAVSFEYNFEVYDKDGSIGDWTEVNQVVERAKAYTQKNIIAKFMYLQLYLKNLDGDDFESYTKPKFSSIGLKYRVLPEV